MVRVRVPATTANLGPGFDCLGMALSLYNYVTVHQGGSGKVQITYSGSAATGDIPKDESNLVYRAIERVYKIANRTPDGLILNLELEAPLARGLGSSASAIVGGMFAANELLGRPLSQEQLLTEVTALEGHPDNVVPCLVGGLTISMVLEGRVVHKKITPASNVTCVVFVPDYELETAKSRGVMPKMISMQDAVFNSCRIPFVLSALQRGELADLHHFMDDRLHQPYRIPLIKGYEPLKQAAADAGASSVCISGAGPTILAVCDAGRAAEVASVGEKILRENGVLAFSLVLRPDLEGCVVES